MIKLYIIVPCIFIIGIVFGFIVGTVITRDYIFNHDANGLCIRGDDGEVYLRLSEHAQNQLADPKTKMLVIRVADASTRNKQTP